MEELGMTLTRAAENHDAAQAYQALRALVPAVRKKSSVAPAVPLLAKDGHAFADRCYLAHRWMRHFGYIEGCLATTWDSLGAVHLDRCRRAKQGQAPGLAELPDRLQWEHSFHKVKKGKAPGLGGLDHDSLALQSLGSPFPTEPLRWRGGEALPLFKGKGSGQRLDQYRSILLENSFAKRWHAWLRSSLIPTFLSVRAPLQSGACRAVSTGALSLLARSFQHICRGRRLSHAMLFVDLQAAFYSVVRVFLCSKPPEELDWPTLAQALHLSESQQAFVEALLADGGDATIKSVQPHLLSYLEDLLPAPGSRYVALASLFTLGKALDRVIHWLTCCSLLPLLRRLNRWPLTWNNRVYAFSCLVRVYCPQSPSGTPWLRPLLPGMMMLWCSLQWKRQVTSERAVPLLPGESMIFFWSAGCRLIMMVASRKQCVRLSGVDPNRCPDVCAIQPGPPSFSCRTMTLCRR